MNLRRIFGVIVLITGVVLLFISNYIKDQVAAGALKVKNAEETVNQANSLFSLTPVTQQLSQGTIQGAREKIAAGKEQIAYYTKLAKWVQIGGFVLIGAGILLIILRDQTNQKKK